MKYAFVNDQGKLVWISQKVFGPAPENHTMYEVEDSVELATHYFNGTEVVAYTSEQLELKNTLTNYPAVWDSASMAWLNILNLENSKKFANQRINQSKNDANSKFSYAGKEFATDPVSRNEIEGINGYVTIRNLFPEDWIGGWKAIDNSYLSITTVTEWQDFYTAMVTSNTLNFSKAQALKDLIGTTTTVAEADAISWDTELV